MPALIHSSLTAEEKSAARPVEPLAHLDYPRELTLKNQALTAFWKHHQLAGLPAPVVPSPRPRHYRTTTRRRARFHAGHLQLGFADSRPSAATLPGSALEPPTHTALYRYLAEELSTPPNRPVARHLNHAIIRGTYASFSVILNLDEFSGSIIRRLKVLANRLQQRPERVLSAFAFCDPSRSEYYFERDAPPVPLRLKKLFGPARFPLQVAGRRYALPPTSFSQVNESMLEPMLAAVRSLLQPRRGDRLIDLYCGYGLFSHHLSDTCDPVIGVDLDRSSIRAAADLLRTAPPSGSVQFSCREISPRTLVHALPSPLAPSARSATATQHALRRPLAASAKSGRASGSTSATQTAASPCRELVILDPPRQGTAPGVIAQLAARHPARVLHIFCGMETLPGALAEWERCGYAVAACVPLDMFPGTPNLETLVLLTPRLQRSRTPHSSSLRRHATR